MSSRDRYGFKQFGVLDAQDTDRRLSSKRRTSRCSKRCLPCTQANNSWWGGEFGDQEHTQLVVAITVDTGVVVAVVAAVDVAVVVVAVVVVLLLLLLLLMLLMLLMSSLYLLCC